MILYNLLLLFTIPVQAQTQEAFSNPYYPFSSGVLVWPVGSEQTVSWSTALTSYNITLWQQSLARGGARAASTPLVGK
jgi:hypothetical protein